ncbi:ABC transporter [Lachnospiraceae bacterium XBB1006]|nr:ABC transporter [Lachnospiraceae bacterium XBB1006]
MEKTSIWGTKTVVYIFLSIITCFLGTWFAFLLAGLVDLVLENNVEKLTFKACMILGFLIVTYIVTYVQGRLKNALLKEKSCALRSEVFHEIFTYTVEEFQGKNSAEYLNSILSDCELIEESYFQGMLSLINQAVQLLIVCIAVIYTNVLMFGVMLVMAIITVAIMKMGNDKIQSTMQAYANTKESFSVFLKEKLGCFPLFSLYNVTDAVVKDFDVESNRVGVTKAEQKNEVLKKSCVAEFVGLGSTVIIMATAVGLAMSGQLTAGFVIASGQLIGKMISPLMVLPGTWAQIKAAEPIKERLNSYFTAKEQVDYIEIKELEKIKVEGVSFQYPKSTQKILDNQTNCFEKGKRYLLKGESGRGKTTYLHLLGKMLSGYEGDIRLNNEVELRACSGKSFFEQVGVITQKNYIFNGTLRENLCLYKDFKDEDVEKALEAASFELQKEKFPEGIDTVITEDGNNFSGGELQRIALARAFLHKFTWIFADEFTTGLDRKNAENVERALLTAPNITVIAISHQDSPEFLALFDEIIEI